MPTRRKRREYELATNDKRFAYTTLLAKVEAVRAAALMPYDGGASLARLETAVAELDAQAQAISRLVIEDSDTREWIGEHLVPILQGSSMEGHMLPDALRKHFLAHVDEVAEGLRVRMFRKEISEFEGAKATMVPIPTPIDGTEQVPFGDPSLFPHHPTHTPRPTAPTLTPTPAR